MSNYIGPNVFASIARTANHLVINAVIRSQQDSPIPTGVQFAYLIFDFSSPSLAWMWQKTGKYYGLDRRLYVFAYMRTTYFTLYPTYYKHVYKSFFLSLNIRHRADSYFIYPTISIARREKKINKWRRLWTMLVYTDIFLYFGFTRKYNIF